MGIKEDYQQAQALAQRGKYQEARQLLITHDHPKTNALLRKINAAILADRHQGKPQQKFTLLQKILFGSISLLCLCSIAGSVLNPTTSQRDKIETALQSVIDVNQIRVNDGIIDVIYTSPTRRFSRIEETALEIFCILQDLDLNGRDYTIVVEDEIGLTLVQTSVGGEEIDTLNCSRNAPDLNEQIDRYYEYDN